MAELDVAVAQGREGLNELLTIVANANDCRLPLDARASLERCHLPVSRS
jgi:hypothetical protein